MENEKSIQGTFWRHVKTGGVYFVTTDNGAVWEPTQEPCVTYESLTDLELPPQVRAKSLFLDGRFEQMALSDVLRARATETEPEREEGL